MILDWLLPFLITLSNPNMNREVMWVSLDERVFEHLRLVGDNQGILAEGSLSILAYPERLYSRISQKQNPAVRG